MLQLLIETLIAVLTVPVLLYSFYTAFLLYGSLRYKPLQRTNASRRPVVTVLMAVYNEKEVVGMSLDAVSNLNYPCSLLQVLVADDSTDETAGIVRTKVAEMRVKGIDAEVCSRDTREGFKAGALNGAVSRAKGEYVLLLDADSTVPPDVVKAGLAALESRQDLSFVSFRVGHYNREANLVTRAFALFQDTTDTLQKMGSSRLGLPFSFQGGFAMVRVEALRRAGYWTPGCLADDADLSCRIYEAGGSGYYLSETVVESEDPWALHVWKRQFARVAEGWAQVLRLHSGKILRTKRMNAMAKAALLMTLLSPFASLSWLVVTFVSAFGIVLNAVQPQSSLFNSPVYQSLLAVPVAAFYAAGVQSLRRRGKLSARNILLLPQVSYLVSGMFVVSAAGFLRGIAGRSGIFVRTPKKGMGGSGYSTDAKFDGTAASELLLGSLAVALSVLLILRLQLFLGLSLLGFGAFTLKSMQLTRLVAGGARKG